MVAMLDELKEQTLEVNRELLRMGLIENLRGGATAIARKEGLVVTRPAKLPCNRLRPKDMRLVTLQGKMLEGAQLPLPDLVSHIELFRRYTAIGAFIHLRSPCASECAKSGLALIDPKREVRLHAGAEIPCTRMLSEKDFGMNEDRTICTAIIDRCGYADVPLSSGVLVGGLAAFAWGVNLREAFHNAVRLEERAKRFSAGDPSF